MKLLIITGASSGIGLATAQEFLHHSFKVVNISRRPCPLETETKNVINIPMNLCHFDEQSLRPIDHLFAQADQITLVHNAFRLDKDNVESITIESLQEILAVNIISAVQLNKWAIPQITHSKGKNNSIIYVGSTLSEKAVPNSFSYVTTKHAQAGMMKATCQDLMGQGIHTSLICPGFTDTEMLRRQVGEDCEILNSLKEGNSYGRLIQPQEIARTIYFAAFHQVVNGCVLHANLGQRES